jgi:putative transposase
LEQDKLQANVLAALTKSAHPGAKAALKEIHNAEDIDKAQVAIKAFELDYGAKYPKAVKKITDDADVLLEFYKYPAEHWIHLKPPPDRIDVRDRAFTDQGHQGPGSRAAGIAMAYKLIEAGPTRWRSSTRRTLSPWSAPAPSSTTESYSNDPTTSHRPAKPSTPDQRSPEGT